MSDIILQKAVREAKQCGQSLAVVQQLLPEISSLDLKDLIITATGILGKRQCTVWLKVRSTAPTPHGSSNFFSSPRNSDTAEFAIHVDSYITLGGLVKAMLENNGHHNGRQNPASLFCDRLYQYSAERCFVENNIRYVAYFEGGNFDEEISAQTELKAGNIYTLVIELKKWY